MKALTHSPSEIFGNQIRYVVPLFQRPYVWTEKDQWQPLWDDVRTLAERVLEGPPAAYGVPPVAPHFLGAIVVEQQLGAVAHIGVRHVIDGQQRLTTLQLLLDAAQWVVQQHGTNMDSNALQVLVENNAAIAASPDEVFKVWPTDRDQDAYRAAMDNDTVVPASLSGSRIAQAHAFFVEAIEDWADLKENPSSAPGRLAALTHALRDHIRVVVIDLEPGDNAQVIFETLNHRGTPLLASDLVKNLVFQIATHQQMDVGHLYRKYWRELDSDYWRQLVAQGRLYRPRIDVFLNRWLTMKLLREVPADRIFADFRDEIVTARRPEVTALLTELAADAKIHREMEQLPDTTREGLFHYRVLRALDAQVVATFLMWLLRQDPQELSVGQRNKALSAVESWLVRRALCRVTTKDHNRAILELLLEVEKNGPAVAGDTTEAFLAAQQADSRYWPNDDTVAASLRDEPVYASVSRSRLRMVLEALEMASRGAFGEGQTVPHGLTIEHVMPQSWRQFWGADIEGDEVAGLRRNRLVQTLGNLTLVNDKLNPALSNRPWTQPDPANGGEDSGKRTYLLDHSELKLNARIVAAHPDSWTEGDIETRGAELMELICKIWPCPPDAIQAPTASASAAAGHDVTSSSGKVAPAKYIPLRDWLATQEADEVRLSFAEIEDIVGSPLPPSARQYAANWYGWGGSRLAIAIREAGRRALNVSLADERVTFAKVSEEADQPTTDFAPWTITDDDVEAARYFANRLSPAARSFYKTLISVAPAKVAAPDIAEQIGVQGATGVAGVLAWPGRYAAETGHSLPSNWEYGDPSQYWMESEVADFFRQFIV